MISVITASMWNNLLPLRPDEGTRGNRLDVFTEEIFKVTRGRQHTWLKAFFFLPFFLVTYVPRRYRKAHFFSWNLGSFRDTFTGTKLLILLTPGCFFSDFTRFISRLMALPLYLLPGAAIYSCVQDELGYSEMNEKKKCPKFEIILGLIAWVSTAIQCKANDWTQMDGGECQWCRNIGTMLIFALVLLTTDMRFHGFFFFVLIFLLLFPLFLWTTVPIWLWVM